LPNRADLPRLHSQLVARQQRRDAAIDEAIAKARQDFDSHEYDRAVSVLTRVLRERRTPEIESLHRRSGELSARCSRLASEIHSSVSTQQFDGLLDTVDEYLTLKPADPEYVKLRNALIARDRKLAEDLAACTTRAVELEKSGKFEQSFELLTTISPRLRNSVVKQQLQRLEQLKRWPVNSVGINFRKIPSGTFHDGLAMA
jgi:hypothetical protein